MTTMGLAGLYSALAPSGAALAPDLDAIHAAGWQAGFAAGEATASDTLAPLRANLAAAAASLQAAAQIDADALRPLFATMVERIATAVLMAELTTGTTALLPLVEAALKLVRVGEAASLRAHPDTLAALKVHLPALATVADVAMAPDAFHVTGASFVIETSIADRLADIVRAMT